MQQILFTLTETQCRRPICGYFMSHPVSTVDRFALVRERWFFAIQK